VASARRGGRQDLREAATLHQLAVAAMSTKPAQLEEAGALLQEALEAEEQEQGVWALGGRAATLQQLARVAERCGNRKAALEWLHEALEMQSRAYGEETPHVNKAAVLSQLASLSLQAGDPVRAAECLGQALAMRRKIHGNDEASHIEVALNLGKLGECHRARGEWKLASSRFAEARRVLEALALREACVPPLPPGVRQPNGREVIAHGSNESATLQRIIGMVQGVGSEGGLPPKLLNQLLQCIQWQRTVAREAGHVMRSVDFASEAQQLQHALEEQKQAASREAVEMAGPGGGAVSPPAWVVQPIIDCRNTVRSKLLKLRSTDEADTRARQQLVDDLQACTLELEQRMQAGEDAAAVTADAEEPADVTADAEAAITEAAFRDASLTFAAELRAAATELGTSAAFVTRAFEVCDALRTRLRAEGTSLTDAQTEAAYRSRERRLAAAGDYALSDESIQKLQEAFGEVTVDAFASGATAQLPRFWSRDAVDGAEAIDAFAQKWEGEHLLVHAPVSLLNDVIDRLEHESGTSAVVVCPFWTGAPWFARLERLASNQLVLPPGSLRAIANRTGQVKSWRVIAFHVTRRN